MKFVNVRCADGIVVAIPASFTSSGPVAQYMQFLAKDGGWHTSCRSDLLGRLRGAFYVK